MAGVVLATLLNACATVPPALRTLDHSTLPPRVELTDTPFFPQTRFHCGPAALATVLTHHNVATTPDALAQQLYIPRLKGSLQAEMVAAARDFEIIALEFERDLSALLEEVANGTPVLVMQNLGLKWLPRWHYAVVVGYDLADRTIVLRSGKRKRWVTPLTVFDRTWRRGGQWALLIVPPDHIPVNIDAPAFVSAASALESTGHTAAAHTAYRTATRRWPDNGHAYMGLGNTAYTLHDHELAAQAFARRIALDPQSPHGWNNLAYPLIERGCAALAIEAARCAVRLAPDDDNYRHTLDEIETLAATATTSADANCTAPVCPAAR